MQAHARRVRVWRRAPAAQTPAETRMSVSCSQSSISGSAALVPGGTVSSWAASMTTPPARTAPSARTGTGTGQARGRRWGCGMSTPLPATPGRSAEQREEDRRRRRGPMGGAGSKAATGGVEVTDASRGEMMARIAILNTIDRDGDVTLPDAHQIVGSRPGHAEDSPAGFGEPPTTPNSPAGQLPRRSVRRELHPTAPVPADQGVTDDFADPVPAPGPRQADPELEQVPDRVGELLPTRSVQGRLQRARPLHVEPTSALDQSQARGQIRTESEKLRRRFCDVGWRFAHNGAVLNGASSVAVVRYRPTAPDCRRE
jgi:hypothetical protein